MNQDQAYFDAFMDAVLEFHAALELTEWDLTVGQSAVDSQAECECYPESMSATITCGQGETDDEPRKLAIHEALEMYDWNLRVFLRRQKMKEKRIDKLIHRRINVIENTLFPKGRKKEGEK